jgi:hypothetical protein
MKWKVYRNFLCKNLLLATFALTLFAAGCAVRPAKMIPDSFDISSKLPYTVRVEGIVGGKETHPQETSQISNPAFTQALTESILKSGLFKGVVKGEGRLFAERRHFGL